MSGCDEGFDNGKACFDLRNYLCRNGYFHLGSLWRPARRRSAFHKRAFYTHCFGRHFLLCSNHRRSFGVISCIPKRHGQNLLDCRVGFGHMDEYIGFLRRLPVLLRQTYICRDCLAIAIFVGADTAVLKDNIAYTDYHGKRQRIELCLLPSEWTVRERRSLALFSGLETAQPLQSGSHAYTFCLYPRQKPS